jgi:hypothetical protein
MIDVLDEMIRRERIYFGQMKERLDQFAGRQNEGQVMIDIYRAYYDAFGVGASALYWFEKAADQYRKGDLSGLLQICGEKYTAPKTTAGGVIMAIVACTRLPSDLFKRRLRWHIRQIASGLIWMIQQQPESPELIRDLEQVGAFLVTFEHPPMFEEMEEEESGAGWGSFLLGAGLGALAKPAASAVWGAIRGQQ